MKSQIETIKEECLKELSTVNTTQEVENIRLKYLGRKGFLNVILRSIKDLPDSERPEVGALANDVRDELEYSIKDRLATIGRDVKRPSIDLTMPSRRFRIGRSHIITRTIDELVDIFTGFGFEVALGPEIETELYNFEKLNFPPDHPARDIQDTLYLPLNYLLRTHTSPAQIRYMETHNPPIRMLAPGRVYREEDIDASHLPVFYQLEGLMVDKGVRFSDLKGILEYSAKKLFYNNLKVRFRPSFFPFTEPSAEMDIECPQCKNKGCNVCGYKGWLEILGAGMVDPNVFESVGYDKYDVSGFAFGMGIERIAMIRHRITDIRLFYTGDIRFLTGV
ncbi:MAG: phenylalanine--tRNA ligase subunit alpha [bacterium]